MPELRPRFRRPSLPVACVLLMVGLLLIGALIWYRPFLLKRSVAVAEVPDPTALFTVTKYRLGPGETACEDLVAVTPDSRLAEFLLRPPKPTAAGGPPVQLTLTAPGYHAALLVPGGYPGGSAALPLQPPSHAVIATACFANRGTAPVLLDGTTEDRTVSRSNLEVNGRPVRGDIALSFLTGQPHRLAGRLGTVFSHASNLTDGLVPVWAVWLFAVLTVAGVPLAILAAFYRAVRADAEAEPERPSSLDAAG